MNSKNKRFSFKWKKWIVSCLLIVTGLTPVVLLSINWTGLGIIYAAGSSAVAPLMNSLTKTYTTVPNRKNIEVNILATGSGNGLETIVNGTKNFGNVSWGPDKSKIKNTNELKALNAWGDSKIKTFTLGIDGIGVIYKPQSNNSFALNIDKNNVGILYEAISGDKAYTYGELLNDPTNKLVIKPYARSGGANKSGTTDAFLKDSNLIKFPSIKPAYYNRLLSGDYGKNVQATKESNVETWKQISNNGGEVGAITYLSAGFIINNMNELADAGFKVALYNNIELSLDKVSNGFNWYRPLNTLFSIKNMTSDMKIWLTWLYTEYMGDTIQNTIKDNGVVPLSLNQLQTMATLGDPSNFLVSDFELYPYDAQSLTFKWGAQL